MDLYRRWWIETVSQFVFTMEYISNCLCNNKVTFYLSFLRVRLCSFDAQKAQNFQKFEKIYAKLKKQYIV